MCVCVRERRIYRYMTGKVGTNGGMDERKNLNAAKIIDA